jgi:hypothetical protein
MARRPKDDPQVTDLRRYRKAREQAKRRPPPKPPGQRILGSNPHAARILVIAALVLAALWALPRLL